MGGRYCAINSPLGSRWGQKSLDLRSRDFCPHLEPRGELIAQYRPPMSFRYMIPRLRSLLRHQRPGKLTTARGRSPRAVVSFPGRWWRNNDRNGGINFYSIMMKQNQLQINKRMQGKCSKLPQNCLSYSMVTCAQLAIVQWSHVTWLFLPGNTCSNHCDVKTRFVTLNFSHTLHKNNWQNTHHNSW